MMDCDADGSGRTPPSTAFDYVNGDESKARWRVAHEKELQPD